jgi:exopolysaccharide biosynthesis protein PssK
LTVSPGEYRVGAPRHLGPWSSALVDDGAVFHRHARILVDSLREQLRRGDRVVLCGFEGHDNAGDSAIYLASLVLMNALGVTVEASVSWEQSSRMLPALLRPCTRVVLVGGGNFGDLYPRVHRRRLEVVAAAAGHLVIQLPVSVWFAEDSSADHTTDLLSAHGDVVLLARDRQSADRAAGAGLLPVLAPDSVAMLAVQSKSPSERAAPILWLARTDDESAVARPPAEPGIEISDWARASDEQVARRSRFAARLPDAALRRIGVHSRVALRLRGRYAIGSHRSISRVRAEPGLDQIRRHRAVITDRLHGHILACMARRPNVIIENVDGKVGAYFDTWTEDLGLTVKAPDPCNAPALARALL